MTTPMILDESSLAATLWSLEEARLAGASPDDPEVRRALEWIRQRRGQSGGYAGVLVPPTRLDIDRRLATPTGENTSVGRGGVSHILGEEAVRATALWSGSGAAEMRPVLLRIRNRFREEPPEPLSALGHFCCFRCSVARWRALAVGRPDGWEDVLAHGLRLLGENATDDDGYRRFPFYYTLLALADIPLDEVETERKRLRPAAERRIGRIPGDDVSSRFRRRAIEWVLT